MKVLLEEKVLKLFNTRQLFQDVLNLFDEYNTKQFMLNDAVYKSLDSSHLEKLIGQKGKTDSVWKSVLVCDKYLNDVSEFKRKIQMLKMQMTDDELIIFNYSLEEREIDKVIMNRINKSNHKYYQIKKSCYLKIALTFGLVCSIEENAYLEATQII